ncbi:MAG: hypothetical protein AB7G76_04115 [Steroidobacteraceae bacterium]
MRILFIPVSAPTGAGEYSRSLAIATALHALNGGAEISFVLNRHAPYAASVPFPSVLLPSSPTFHPREVSALICERQPDLVVFDNAGRTAQLRAARGTGARIVYISSRPRQRRKAFRLKWLPLIDEHWIAWPEFMAGSLSAAERLKLHIGAQRPVVRFIDTIVPTPSAEESSRVAARFGLEPEQFTLVVPGGGGAHPGAAEGPQTMAAAALRLARRGQPTLLVGPHRLDDTADLRHASHLPMRDLAALMARARVVVANGGDTLLQALSFRRVCVAAPLAHDQVSRIRHCADAGIATSVELDDVALALAAEELFHDGNRRSQQAARISEHPIRNDLDVAVDTLARLAA